MQSQDLKPGLSWSFPCNMGLVSELLSLFSVSSCGEQLGQLGLWACGLCSHTALRGASVVMSVLCPSQCCEMHGSVLVRSGAEIWTCPSHGKCLLNQVWESGRLYIQGGMRRQWCGCSQQLVVRGGFVEAVEICVSLCVEVCIISIQ